MILLLSESVLGLQNQLRRRKWGIEDETAEQGIMFADSDLIGATVPPDYQVALPLPGGVANHSVQILLNSGSFEVQVRNFGS